ncbi:MAG: S41 family peptidase [Pseudomonadota bacterium]
MLCRILPVAIALSSALIYAASGQDFEQKAEGAAAAIPVKNNEMLEAATAIKVAMRRYHYNPDELNELEYLKIEAAIMALGHSAVDRDAFLKGFREIWQDAPFSHVNLRKARGTAAETATYLDTITVGPDAVQLTWADDDAILTVNTMMGTDTVSAITAAYIELEEWGAERLIIDLRQNTGGAFAVRPLVEHLLSHPYDAGLFVSQNWYAMNARPPSARDLEGLIPWEGWSITSFWRDVTATPATRVQFTPVSPAFTGPAYVLTSKKTASAAELAVDALKGSGRAKIVGEQTSGAMLSQKPFDIPGDMLLFLPIADYYSIKNGRIEGHGVVPDIAVDADEALNFVLAIRE